MFAAGRESWLARSGHLESNPEPSNMTTPRPALTVFDVWKLLGLEGTAKPFCRSPFRDDRNPSFSIYDGGHRWNDHASGDGGNAADFVAKAGGLSAQDAAKKLIELARTAPRDKENVSSKNRTHHARAPRQKYDPFKDPQKAAKRQNWSRFEIPTRAEIREIAELRGLSPEGITLALTMAFYSALTSPKAAHGLSLIPAG